MSQAGLQQSKKQQNHPYTPKQQYIRITILGICFMFMFTSFCSLQNMISKLYEDYGYNNLGQSALLVIYFSFAAATFISTYIIKHLGYKKTMIFSCLGYAVFEATGLLIVAGVKINPALVWIYVNVGAAICGFCGSTLWVAQGGYTSAVASQNRRNQLFGLFLALMMSSQLFGNILGTFVLGRINNLVYFMILTTLGVSSSALFLFLPDVQIKASNNQIILGQQINKVWGIMKDKKYKYLNIYFVSTGVTVAFYAGFLYKIVKLSVPQEQNEQLEDYQKRISQYQGYVLITLGLSQIFTGVMMNRYSQRFNKFKLAIIGTLIVQLATFLSFVCYHKQSYPLCFVVSFLWGSAETYLQTNTAALVPIIFPGKIEGFSAFRIFSSIGVVFALLISILLSHVDPLYFLTIILALQTVVTATSINLKNLQPSSSRNKQALLLKDISKNK